MKIAKNPKRDFFPVTWSGLIVVCLAVMLTLLLFDSSEAKKRKRAYSPVKVEEIATSPDPFIVGQSPLTFSMVVQLPYSIKNTNVLEVSVLITSPTRRSMSFVERRILLDKQNIQGRPPKVPVDLLWDGKDQYEQYVADGAYFYEIQAKLMNDVGEGPRTKVVAHQEHGTLEVLAYVGEVLPPVASESDLPEVTEGVGEEEPLEEDDVQVVEEGLKVTDGLRVSGEQNGSEEEETQQNGGQDPLVSPQLPGASEEIPESLSEKSLQEPPTGSDEPDSVD